MTRMVPVTPARRLRDRSPASVDAHEGTRSGRAHRAIPWRYADGSVRHRAVETRPEGSDLGPPIKRARLGSRLTAALAAGMLSFAPGAMAQIAPAPLSPAPSAPASSGPGFRSPLDGVGFDQNLGAKAPLDVMLRDESGRAVPLGSFFRGRPVILSLAYYDCPMLCGMALQGLASSLKTLSFTAGREFDVVTVSFNPLNTSEQARKKKATYLAEYGRPGASEGWHFLTGDAPALQKLTRAVGFRYVWDEEQKQYAHGTGIVLLSADGTISRYMFGIDYAPRDLRLGLIDASQGRIGSLADKLLLLCYHYDPSTGRYSAAAIDAVRIGAILTVLALGTFVLLMLRRERTAAGARLVRAAGSGR